MRGNLTRSKLKEDCRGDHDSIECRYERCCLVLQCMMMGRETTKQIWGKDQMSSNYADVIAVRYTRQVIDVCRILLGLNVWVMSANGKLLYKRKSNARSKEWLMDHV